MTVNIGLRRQAMQLAHFTDGNVPPGLLNAPDGWSAEQIRQFQEWFDSVLAGNLGGRSRLVWGPAGARYQPFKEAPYKDEFDEWLARIACYAFSLPSTAFTRQSLPRRRPGSTAPRRDRRGCRIGRGVDAVDGVGEAAL